MAIINCPHCNQRISSLKEICPHCEAPVAAPLSREDAERIAARQRRERSYRAGNLSYLGLVMLVVGSLWWWFDGEAGWMIPPPVGASTFLLLGLALYILARGYMIWLQVSQKRPRSGR